MKDEQIALNHMIEIHDIDNNVLAIIVETNHDCVN
jgi:hypothetical protein